MATFRFTINGKIKDLNTEPERSVLEVLREDLGLTGTKYGCGEGQCRACTVLLDGKPVVSCLTPIRSVHGKKLLTIEGLAEGAKLHPVQQAFIEAGAMQCGYCTPGMILRTVALLERKSKPTDPEIIEGLNGNICRCTGYHRIMDAVRRAAGTAGQGG